MHGVGSRRSPVIPAVGAAAALCMALFAFFPSPITGALLALALIAGVAVPEVGVLAMALSLFTLPLIEGVGPVRDLRVDELMLVAVLVGAGVRWVVRRDVPRTDLTVPFLAFIAVSVASIVLRIALGADVNPRDFAAPEAKQVLRFALFLACVWLAGSSPFVVRLRAFVVAGGNAGAALGLAQVMVGPVGRFIVENYLSLHGGEPKVFYGQRAYGAFDGNPNHFGLAMAFVAILALARSAELPDRRGKIAWFTTTLLPIFAVVASGSRADYVILAGVLLIMAILHRDVWVPALVGMVLYTVIVPNALAWRIKVLFVGDDGSFAPGTSLMGKIEALGGKSFSSTLVITDNFYLDVWYNYWPLALALFLWFLFRGFRRLWREERVEREHRSIVLAALVAWAAMAVASVQGPFFGASRVVEIFWLLSGLAWGVFALPVRAVASDGHVGEPRGGDRGTVQSVSPVEDDPRTFHH